MWTWRSLDRSRFIIALRSSISSSSVRARQSGLGLDSLGDRMVPAASEKSSSQRAERSSEEARFWFGLDEGCGLEYLGLPHAEGGPHLHKVFRSDEERECTGETAGSSHALTFMGSLELLDLDWGSSRSWVLLM
uniref:Uncharacterized protein n=1 Tax=Knipowitschia caucasica TaxID=637954 RepID=A0AAV2KZZ1_KNICA